MMFPMSVGKHVSPGHREPTRGPDHRQIEHFDGTGDDVGQATESDDIGQDHDDHDAARIDCRKHPNHHSDEPACENSTQDGGPERDACSLFREREHRGLNVGLEHRSVSDNPGEEMRTDEICDEDYRPQFGNSDQRRDVSSGEQGNNGGERVFGKELLPADNDD